MKTTIPMNRGSHFAYQQSVPFPTLTHRVSKSVQLQKIPRSMLSLMPKGLDFGGIHPEITVHRFAIAGQRDKIFIEPVVIQRFDLLHYYSSILATDTGWCSHVRA